MALPAWCLLASGRAGLSRDIGGAGQSRLASYIRRYAGGEEYGQRLVDEAVECVLPLRTPTRHIEHVGCPADKRSWEIGKLDFV